jgi:hypothetical protein
MNRKQKKQNDSRSMAAANKIQSCCIGILLEDLIIWCSSPLLFSSKSVTWWSRISSAVTLCDVSDDYETDSINRQILLIVLPVVCRCSIPIICRKFRSVVV